jgi:hypothetical protein
LRRSDIDLENTSANMERSVLELGPDLVIKEPKTQAGVRSVAADMAGARAEPPPGYLRRGRFGRPGLRRLVRSNAAAGELRHDLEAG